VPGGILIFCKNSGFMGCSKYELMRDLLILVVHLITTVFRLTRPGGVRAVIAESVLAKHQNPEPFSSTIAESLDLGSPDCRILFSVDTTKAAEQNGDCVQAIHVAEMLKRAKFCRP
jgi:hypothetical protein